jgi:hypothetical protein
MTYLEAPFVEKLREGGVLAQGLIGHSADGFIGCELDREACTRGNAVVWPWIVRPRIAPCVNFGNQTQICIFKAAPRQK